ncbi:Transcription factor tau subunit [Wickerhamomyces ciferrii]|uniref:Transcription factor tau subunit n=1 Tax=Wickerhamomyces ciferrii (strain ATCC 14091 / BCRC 22168 / CBS 111 / JCM 3599 / NBRC 0793 / NRRL Y-1031 F-60-10) TaxID=1206466 RepID=K0KJZ6_WICCF|nr:Transcription factor tau subunit [Wickerhamomyces ciferrii]CCH41764.1 Transcription factor tau subunit [Wickerhamomyces ciferrii]
MVADLLLQRVDLLPQLENLAWSDDGSLAVNTAGQLSLYKPKYEKDEVKNANSLFEIQRFELASLPRNQIFQNEIDDEVGSTNYSAAEEAIVKFTWSPLTSSKVTYLALLTNTKSIHILANGEAKHSIDRSLTQRVSTQKELDDYITHSIEWLILGNVLVLLTGQANGTIKAYYVDDQSYKEVESITINEGVPIVQIKADQNNLIAVTSTNEIYKISNPLQENSTPAQIIKEADRFKIYDILLQTKKILYTSPSQFNIIDIESGTKSTTTTNILDFSNIIPNGSNYLIVSHTKSIQLDKDLKLIQDNKVQSLRKRRVNRYNSKLDSINLKDDDFKILGIDYNHSGKVLAILYSIEADLGFRYKITSQTYFKIAFITLDNDFKIQASPLATYQQFIISGVLPDSEIDSGVTETNLDVSLAEYLKTNILNDRLISGLISRNIVSRDQDLDIAKRYADLLVRYINHSGLEFDNVLDKITYKSLLLLSTGGYNGATIGKIEIKTDVFEETFNFDEINDLEPAKSETGHEWNRCALTFIPILSTDVKIDPVTQKRIIDIENDKLNDYGFLTRTILETLNEISIYSGCRYE